MNRLLQKSTKFSNKKLTLKSKQVDLKIFKSVNTECNRHSDDIPITERCSPTKRLCVASLYFEKLKTSKIQDSGRRSLFVEFNESVYQSLLDDITHFIKSHGNDIARVHKEWTEQYGLPKCTASKCAHTARHYDQTKRDKSNEKQQEDATDILYAFYEATYDRIHHFIFHLFEIGMRVNAESFKLSQLQIGNNDDDDEVMSSKLFAAKREYIKSQRKAFTLDLERMNPKTNKFIMYTLKEQQGMTLIDALFRDISKEGNVTQQKAERMYSFLRDNAFDSDALELDLVDFTDSNLQSVIESQSIADTVSKFLRSVRLRRTVFSTGFHFKYGAMNRDHKMFVKPKYQNLKEEIMESGYLSKSDWIKFIDTKGRKFWNTSKRVKKMKAKRDCKYYQLTVEHIFVVILYCDFSDLCTEFSGTYRRNHVFEGLKWVISRHSEYAHFGQILFETIERFGISRNHGNGAQDAECGPFYVGINCVLNFGTFAITLNGPCSTSTDEEVAVNFAKENGMILKLNNDTYLAEEQTFFDCSWISNYSGESERLFIAGYFALRIVSIKIVRTARIHQKVMNALYLFDAMISGVHQDKYKKKENEAHYETLKVLVDWTLNDSEIDSESTRIDEFIKNEWNLFTQNKEEIKLNLKQMDDEYETLSKLVMFNVVKNKWSRTADGKDNLLKAEWLSMFPAVRRVYIKTSGKYYKFRLKALCESMKAISPLITVTVRDYGEWIDNAMSAEILAAYRAIGWNIKYHKDDEKLVIRSRTQ